MRRQFNGQKVKLRVSSLSVVVGFFCNGVRRYIEVKCRYFKYATYKNERYFVNRQRRWPPLKC
jgi:hypothetical protein